MKEKYALTLTRVIYEQAFVIVEATNAEDAFDISDNHTFENSGVTWRKTGEERTITGVYDAYGRRTKLV